MPKSKITQYNIELFLDTCGFNQTIALIRLWCGNKAANALTKQLARDNKEL
jgi:hypothetical protein